MNTFNYLHFIQYHFQNLQVQKAYLKHKMSISITRASRLKRSRKELDNLKYSNDWRNGTAEECVGGVRCVGEQLLSTNTEIRKGERVLLLWRTFSV